MAPETKIRILAIDSPETKNPQKPGIECWGPESTQYATTVLLNRMVVLVPDPTQDAVDRYGRTLAYVELADGPNAGQDFSTMAALAGRGPVLRLRPASPAAADRGDPGGRAGRGAGPPRPVGRRLPDPAHEDRRRMP
jgi:hypothetical protein